MEFHLANVDMDCGWSNPLFLWSAVAWVVLGAIVVSRLLGTAWPVRPWRWALSALLAALATPLSFSTAMGLKVAEVHSREPEAGVGCIGDRRYPFVVSLGVLAAGVLLTALRRRLGRRRSAS